MGIVEDLDAARRLGEIEEPLDALEEPGLGGRFRHLAAERLAGIGVGMLDQKPLFAALGGCDLDPAAGMARQRLGKQRLFLDLLGQEHEIGDRFVVVELGEEGRQDLARGERAVGAREIGAVAPVLPGPEEEDLDAGLAALLGDAEDIRLFNALRIDALVGGDEAHGLDAVADARRLLVVEGLGRLFHGPGEIGLHRLALAGEEVLGARHQLTIGLRRDQVHARCRAALDLVEQAGSRPVLENAVIAGP